MNNLDLIAAQTVQRYTDRYNKLGKHIRTLGWGTEQQQQYRFAQTLAATDFNGKSLLDIGCGFADLNSFVKSQNIALKSYTGWDINPSLVKEATSAFSDDDNVSFACQNITELADNQQPVADIGVMLGLLNFNLKDQADNYEYSRLCLEKVFNCVGEVLVVDFLSTELTPDYAKEDFVFYHNPAKMLEMALSLTPKVVLKHDYEPIPQREFMLFLYK